MAIAISQQLKLFLAVSLVSKQRRVNAVDLLYYLFSDKDDEEISEYYRKKVIKRKTGNQFMLRDVRRYLDTPFEEWQDQVEDYHKASVKAKVPLKDADIDLDDIIMGIL